MSCIAPNSRVSIFTLFSSFQYRPIKDPKLGNAAPASGSKMSNVSSSRKGVQGVQPFFKLIQYLSLKWTTYGEGNAMVLGRMSCEQDKEIWSSEMFSLACDTIVAGMPSIISSSKFRSMDELVVRQKNLLRMNKNNVRFCYACIYMWCKF